MMPNPTPGAYIWVSTEANDLSGGIRLPWLPPRATEGAMPVIVDESAAKVLTRWLKCVLSVRFKVPEPSLQPSQNELIADDRSLRAQSMADATAPRCRVLTRKTAW